MVCSNFPVITVPYIGTLGYSSRLVLPTSEFIIGPYPDLRRRRVDLSKLRYPAGLLWRAFIPNLTLNLYPRAAMEYTLRFHLFRLFYSRVPLSWPQSAIIPAIGRQVTNSGPPNLRLISEDVSVHRGQPDGDDSIAT
jgi:hypothetical protein